MITPGITGEGAAQKQDQPVSDNVALVDQLRRPLDNQTATKQHQSGESNAGKDHSSSARHQHPARAGKAPSALMPHHILPLVSPSITGKSPTRADTAEHQTVYVHPGAHRHHHHNHKPQLFTQVSDWFQQEMSHVHTLEKGRATTPLPAPEESTVLDFKSSLERLGKILEEYAIASEISTTLSRRHRSLSATRRKGLQRGSGSDTEYDEAYVPNADVVLDNTKTLSYCGGETSNEVSGDGYHAGVWDIFKTEIVRLTHTLGLKGWRRIPLVAAPEIGVVRLSGALTNAVYVVSPPKNIREATYTGLQLPRPRASPS
ncbi:hypothetical protein KEM54_003876 [Ascosphaera aggregata]|nr:hypothetical protein KEM54_003876 [Ascosphaera aggregata]